MEQNVIATALLRKKSTLKIYFSECGTHDECCNFKFYPIYHIVVKPTFSNNINWEITVVISVEMEIWPWAKKARI